jgi:hypothetical protein
MLIRHIKLFAVGLLAFGVLLIYGVGLSESRYLQH